MIGRRDVLKIAATLTAAAYPFHLGIAAPPKRIVFVHGRDQQGLDPAKLRDAWIAALKAGASSLGKDLPDGIDIVFPYYGDALADLVKQADVPLASDIHTKGSSDQEEYLVFQEAVAQEVRAKAGVTDSQVDAEFGANPKEKGPLNWEWVQAILRALDKHGGGLSQAALERLTRDVFLYATRPAIKVEIDKIVSPSISEEPTLVVAHSLGTVVAYNILRSDPRPLKVPLFLTLGSPLGIRAIRNKFKPIKHPAPVSSWLNAYDKRDVVALYPLDSANFGVTPPIENYAEVKNHTENRHGIAGYLDDKVVSGRIFGSL